MVNQLASQLKTIVNLSLCDTKTTYCRIIARIEQDNLTRDEDNKTHFCVYFLPYNSDTQEIFIVHHKKSGLWLSPGGHIDKGEVLLEALNREIKEELGITKYFNKPEVSFMLSITDINNKNHLCRAHYDVWYLVKTNGESFNVDPQEFHETKWMTFDKAREIVTEPNNIRALSIVEQNHLSM